MPSQRLLVLKDVFNYGDSQEQMDDARVTVDDTRVLIKPHDSDEGVVLDFSRDQWLELVEFVRWVWQPGPEGAPVGGRE